MFKIIPKSKILLISAIINPLAPLIKTILNLFSLEAPLLFQIEKSILPEIVWEVLSNYLFL
jgi:hypothetical protein